MADKEEQYDHDVDYEQLKNLGMKKFIQAKATDNDIDEHCRICEELLKKEQINKE